MSLLALVFMVPRLPYGIYFLSLKSVSEMVLYFVSLNSNVKARLRRLFPGVCGIGGIGALPHSYTRVSASPSWILYLGQRPA